MQSIWRIILPYIFVHDLWGHPGRASLSPTSLRGYSGGDQGRGLLCGGAPALEVPPHQRGLPDFNISCFKKNPEDKKILGGGGLS